MGSKESIVIYEYQPDRKYDRPKAFLKDFKGYINSHGYEAYHGLSAGVVICGCFAHARRKFDEALKILKPHEQIGSKALASKNYCDKLFEIERKLAD